jgi:hypothetical protein
MNKKYIFLAAFTSALLVSCGGGDANAELEKEKLKLEREKLELEKSKATQVEPQSEGTDESPKKEENNKEADEERRKEVAEKASKANRFSAYTEAVVVVKRTYFHSKPDDSTIKKNVFIIEGDRIMVEKSQRNFVFVTYTNESNGKVTSGWIKSDDLEPIYAD